MYCEAIWIKEFKWLRFNSQLIYMMSCSWHVMCVYNERNLLLFSCKYLLSHQDVSSVSSAALITSNAARQLCRCRWNRGPLRLKCKWVFGCWRPQLRLNSPSTLKMAPVFVSHPPAQLDYFWLLARNIKETGVEERSGFAVQTLNLWSIGQRVEYDEGHLTFSISVWTRQ